MSLLRPSAYAPHEAFVAPARAKPALWRLAVGILGTGALYMIMGSAIYVAFAALDGGPAGASWEDLGTPMATLGLLVGFAFMVIGCFGAASLLHGRDFASLMGPRARFWASFRVALVAILAVEFVIFALPPYVMPELAPGLALPRWLLFLPISLAALFIQVFAEEIFFRGYIQQQLAARFASPLVWMVLPSALFAFGHYDPQGMGGNALMVVAWSFTFGLVAADLTARTGSLGPATALHFANNAFGILLVSPPGPLSGLALYTLPFTLADLPAGDPLILIDLGLILCGWLAIRLALKV
ncbi:CPBP family intramembrane glutamic endopeptidase [Pseudoruegeria sp. SHC-113]|uniref:CPBP family intramembrane glutamic endopeptidase n=1 Tax=Pseudoruegeria sp. SHC-113 TaxID=2855439 RepID=UPI0021BA87B9|nr:type II CAAX endopeptidase family protein [Pseudoruegeria sp. SHC-113]MCT8159090.1 CPBP family intramembrane metalloprotease [Pseudoruegeria sp. SHC-113]